MTSSAVARLREGRWKGSGGCTKNAAMTVAAACWVGPACAPGGGGYQQLAMQHKEDEQHNKQSHRGINVGRARRHNTQHTTKTAARLRGQVRMSVSLYRLTPTVASTAGQVRRPPGPGGRGKASAHEGTRGRQTETQRAAHTQGRYLVGTHRHALAERLASHFPSRRLAATVWVYSLAQSAAPLLWRSAASGPVCQCVLAVVVLKEGAEMARPILRPERFHP